MLHARFCLEELAAELDHAIAGVEAVRALAQLDAREAAGETLEAVDGGALRAVLEQQIEALAVVRARRRVDEIMDLLATTRADVQSRNASVLVQEPEALQLAPADALVIEAPRPSPRFKPLRQRVAEARAAVVAGAAMLVAVALASPTGGVLLAALPG